MSVRNVQLPQIEQGIWHPLFPEDREHVVHFVSAKTHKARHVRKFRGKELNPTMIR
jgi:hypothetical protein